MGRVQRVNKKQNEIFLCHERQYLEPASNEPPMIWFVYYTTCHMYMYIALCIYNSNSITGNYCVTYLLPKLHVLDN